jgi:hypothetical protein
VGGRPQTLAKIMKILTTLLLMLISAGCLDPNSDADEQSELEETETSGLVVAVLGGDTSKAFTEDLKSAGIANAQAATTADVST